MTSVPLCAADDVGDGDSAGFVVETARGPVRLMVIRRHGAFHVYVNSCPHRRLPLDFQPGRFLTEDGVHILCTNHIALFRIEDGACVDGPCRGQGLEVVPFEIRDGTLSVLAESGVLAERDDAVSEGGARPLYPRANSR